MAWISFNRTTDSNKIENIVLDDQKSRELRRIRTTGLAVYFTVAHKGDADFFHRSLLNCDSNLLTCDRNLLTCDSNLLTWDRNLLTCDRNLLSCDSLFGKTRSPAGKRLKESSYIWNLGLIDTYANYPVSRGTKWSLILDIFF